MRFDKTLEIQRAMAIYAHPDDAEFGMAGTVAKWANAGVEFTYCMVTNGASGSRTGTSSRRSTCGEPSRGRFGSTVRM